MVSYAILGSVVAVTGEGAYTTQDIAATMEAAGRDPQLREPARLLIDISRSHITHTFDDIRDRLELIRREFPNTHHVAFVVAGTARSRLAQIYQSRVQEDRTLQVEVFASRHDAEQWLDAQVEPGA